MSTEPGPGFLELRGLTKAFGDLVVVDALDLAVEKTEVLALLGPSGSGKTTLLRLLAGFEIPDAGTVQLAGEDVTAVPAARRGVGMVFQHYALFPHLDVGANVAFGLASQRLERARVSERVSEVLALVDLAGFEKRTVTALSGGQQQRVAVARALAPRPRLLLLDEPLSNLDPSLRERTRRGLKELVRRVGITTVLVTHEQQEAFDLGDRVAVLFEGRLQQVGTPEELHERPANRFVAGFVGRANVLPGSLCRRDGEPAVALAGLGVEWGGESSVPLPDGAPVELMLRPEALTFASADAPGAVRGVVVERLYGGGLSLFRVRLGREAGALREVEVLARSGAAREGDTVMVAPQPAGPRGRIWGSSEGSAT